MAKPNKSLLTLDEVEKIGDYNARRKYLTECKNKLWDFTTQIYNEVKDGDLTLAEVARVYKTTQDVIFFYVHYETAFEPIKVKAVEKFDKIPYPLDKRDAIYRRTLL